MGKLPQVQNKMLHSTIWHNPSKMKLNIHMKFTQRAPVCHLSCTVILSWICLFSYSSFKNKLTHIKASFKWNIRHRVQSTWTLNGNMVFLKDINQIHRQCTHDYILWAIYAIKVHALCALISLTTVVCRLALYCAQYLQISVTVKCMHIMMARKFLS